jgi:hypothetical protein
MMPETLVFNEESSHELAITLGDKPTVVASCMDKRYVLKQRHPLENHGVKSFYLIAHAGSVHVLSVPREVSGGRSLGELARLYDAGKIVAEHSFDLGLTKAGISQALLIGHADCAHMEWEGHKFADKMHEEGIHEFNLLEASQWINRKFPTLGIFTCYSYMDATGHVQIKNLQKRY